MYLYIYRKRVEVPMIVCFSVSHIAHAGSSLELNRILTWPPLQPQLGPPIIEGADFQPPTIEGAAHLSLLKPKLGSHLPYSNV